MQAELVAKSPSAIADFLKQAAAKSDQGDYSDCSFYETEQALLALKDEQVNIALALTTGFMEMAKTLFFMDPPNLIYRLAVLSNRRLGRSLWKFNPEELFDGKPDALHAYLADASLQELSALFERPDLDEYFLCDFLSGRSVWEVMSDKQRRVVMKALTVNPRMSTETDPMLETDGMTVSNYDSVFACAWQMTERLPATLDWAMALRPLLNRTCLISYLVKDPIAVAGRWTGEEPADSQATGDYLGPFGSIREALGRLAIASGSADGEQLLAHEDIAIRAAAYAMVELTPEQMKTSFERDGYAAFRTMLANERLWQEQGQRSLLQSFAGLLDQKNGPMSLKENSAFRNRRDHYREKHPEWFEAEDRENALARDARDVPASKADMAALNEDLQAAYSEIKRQLASLSKRSSFILWFSLGALVGAWFS